MRPRSTIRFRRSRPRRGFTLIELVVAGVVMAFILGTVSTSLAQLGRIRNTSREVLTANLRAHNAISQIRRQIISAMRSDDLFYTHLSIIDDSSGDMPRDEILVFTNSIRTVRSNEYNGEGIEYESEFRIIEDEGGPVLWLRRDPILDEYPDGGGQAEPLVEGITGVQLEVFDGYDWYDEWDSDNQGIPHAVRITVFASGHQYGEDEYDAAQTVLRTIVPIDRVPVPREWVLPTDEEEEALNEYLNELLAQPEPDADGTGGDVDGGGGATGDRDDEEGGGGGGLVGNDGPGSNTGNSGGGGGGGGGRGGGGTGSSGGGASGGRLQGTGGGGGPR